MVGFFVSAADHSLDAISQIDYVEVDEQPDSLLAQSEVGEQLRFVKWQELIDSLDFQNNRRFDQNIEAIPEVDPVSVILNGKQLLDFDRQAARPELATEALPIGPFEQARAKSGVHPECSSKNGVRNLTMNEMRIVSHVGLTEQQVCRA